MSGVGEGVGAAASTLTFIGVALKATITVLEVISGIKDGPHYVEQLAAAVQNLQTVLTQLRHSAALNQASATFDFGPLQRLMEACKDDVVSYEAALGRLRISATDKKAGKAWKKIKTVLKEKDLGRILTAVNHHVSKFIVQLSLLGAYVELETPLARYLLTATLSATLICSARKSSTILRAQSLTSLPRLRLSQPVPLL